MASKIAAVMAVTVGLGLAACGGGVDWSKRGLPCDDAGCADGLTCVTHSSALADGGSVSSGSCERLCADGCSGMCLAAADESCTTPDDGPSICACKSL